MISILLYDGATFLGDNLKGLVSKAQVNLKDISGKSIAVDAYNTLYQFLAIIRQPDGTPLKDSCGKVTSHLSGLLYRNSNLVEMGIGEIFLNEVDRDGMMQGYDVELIASINSVVDVPVIACGGAGSLEHMKEAAERGACALAAGSMFVYKGKQKGVLINYPSENQLRQYLK